MKIAGFIGVYDKIDMLLNISKILTTAEKKVAILDLTKTQKTKYIVPSIIPTTKYITDFEDIDVAIGFDNLRDLEKYYSTGEEGLPYDIILIDIDSREALCECLELEMDYKYFVSGFDLYSLKLGLDIFQGLFNEIEISKVLYSKFMVKEEDDYLNYLSEKYNIKWKEYRIYFPFENGDMSVAIENQRLQKIKLKKYTPMYKDSLIYISEEILEEQNDIKIRKMIKAIEKGE